MPGHPNFAIGYLQHDVSSGASAAAENGREQATVESPAFGPSAEQRSIALHRSNKRLAAALDSAFDAIWILSATGIIEYVNEGSIRLFGYEPHELIGTVPAYFSHDETFLQQFATTWMRVLDTGVPERVQGAINHKTGKLIECDFALARIADDDEGHFVCSIRDITIVKESQRLKDRFVSMVNHELRQPVSVMMLSADKLRTYYDRMTEAQRKSNINQLFQQSETMLELIESILDLSRLDSSTKARARGPVDVAAVAGSVIQEFQQAADAKNQVLTASGFDDGDYTIVGDPIDLMRVWRNLISNAVKYTPEHGRVSVRVGRLHVNEDVRASGGLSLAGLPPPSLKEGWYIAGQVADSGPGIPPEDLPELFSRFHRGWAKHSGIPGTGLGLALVQELMMLYSGGITVNSIVGGGTTFTFYMPVAA